MSLAYGPLAAWYDKLTLDVPYEEFLSFYEREFKDDGGEFHTILDLCCGTGTLTWLMAEHGYEMIAADASADMLMEASGKAAEVKIPPLFPVSGSSRDRPVRHCGRLRLLARRHGLYTARGAWRGVPQAAFVHPTRRAFYFRYPQPRVV